MSASPDKPLSRFHQPISVPGRQLLAHIPLKFVKKKAFGGGGRALNQDIPLVPFIDFLLCLVCFLLASFSASGELPVDKNVTLPTAENTESMVTAPIVAVTGIAVTDECHLPTKLVRLCMKNGRRDRRHRLRQTNQAEVAMTL